MSFTNQSSCKVAHRRFIAAAASRYIAAPSQNPLPPRFCLGCLLLYQRRTRVLASISGACFHLGCVVLSRVLAFVSGACFYLGRLLLSRMLFSISDACFHVGCLLLSWVLSSISDARFYLGCLLLSRMVASISVLASISDESPPK